MTDPKKKVSDISDKKVMNGFYTGSLLISTPDILDPRFSSSVIYLISHDEKGAMGFIINKPMQGIHLTDILKRNVTKINIDDDIDYTVFFGGPVEFKSGFLLHSSEYEIKNSTLKINDNFCLTYDTRALTDIFEGKGPISSLFMLGYAGWYPGQLEKEIMEDSWLVTKANPELVFSKNYSDKYNWSLDLLGINNAFFSRNSGKA